MKVGVQIRYDNLRLDFKEFGEMIDCLLEVLVILVFIKIAQELACDHIAIFIQRNCILKLSPKRQNMMRDFQFFRNSLGVRDITSGASQKKRFAVHNSEH